MSEIDTVYRHLDVISRRCMELQEQNLNLMARMAKMEEEMRVIKEAKPQDAPAE